MNWLYILFVAIIFIGFPFLIWYSIKTIVDEKHGKDVRVVWYFFSLSLVITIGIFCWAEKVGAINHNGFSGDQGKWLNSLLTEMLDLNQDLGISLSIVALIILPQVIGYFLSGLSGCAGAPLFVDKSLKFLVWTLIKSLSICAGIVFSLLISCAWMGWESKADAFTMAYLSTVSIVLSFVVLLMYRAMETVMNDLKKNFPRLTIWCLRVHHWCIRHSESVTEP